jgi:amidase
VIAAGDVPMALGCDQGGSIRIPAAWCGVVGLKPTYGLVPYTGICALEASIDHVGPMGDTVEDVARLLTVIAGPDGLDPRQKATMPQVDYLAAMRQGLRGLRIGIATQGFGRPESDPATDSAVREALARMQSAGAEVEEVSVPAHDEMFDIWNAICIEGTAVLMFGAGTGGYAEGHVSMSLLDAFAQGWRSRPEALSASATMALLMGDHMQHRYHGRYYAKAQALRGAVRAAYTKAFGSCDVVVMPTVPFPALPMPPTQATWAEMLAVALPMIGNTAALNASGHPAISVPVALRDGLPVGMMMIGRHFQDAITLRAAAGLEALGNWQNW